MINFHVHGWQNIHLRAYGIFSKNNWPKDSNIVVVEGKIQKCDCEKMRIVPFNKDLPATEVES